MADTPFTSQIIADVGISMGDEGKGRLIYELIQELRAKSHHAAPVGVVMKVNGGANSGHTAGGLKLNLLPAGIIEKSVDHLAIGIGVVADPRKFLWEAVPLEARGYSVLSRLRIDERTLVSDVCHRLLDLAFEFYRSEILGEPKRGSTGRGITPAYVDEVGQWQIHYASFRDGKEAYAEKLKARADRACRVIQHVCRVTPEAWNSFFDILSQAEKRANAEAISEGHFPESEFDFRRFAGAEPFTLNLEAIIDAYWEAGERLRGNIVDIREICRAELARGRHIIGEFGQSFWLDKRHGFPPNVTASHTFTPEIFHSAGLPVQPVHTFGVCKAYDTKVGTHTFLTQMQEGHPLRGKLEKLEFGTSTGRQRMVGWFDAVEKGDALRYGGFQDLMINKLDALSYSDAWQGGELLVCTGYRAPDGAVLNSVPRDDAFRQSLTPVYRQTAGWSEDISGVRRFDDLPEAARKYVAIMVKSICDVAYRNEEWPRELPNLRYIGVGPDPEQIVREIPPTRELAELA